MTLRNNVSCYASCVSKKKNSHVHTPTPIIIAFLISLYNLLQGPPGYTGPPGTQGPRGSQVSYQEIKITDRKRGLGINGQVNVGSLCLWKIGTVLCHLSEEFQFQNVICWDSTWYIYWKTFHHTLRWLFSQGSPRQQGSAGYYRTSWSPRPARTPGNHAGKCNSFLLNARLEKEIVLRKLILASKGKQPVEVSEVGGEIRRFDTDAFIRNVMSTLCRLKKLRFDVL